MEISANTAISVLVAIALYSHSTIGGQICQQDNCISCAGPMTNDKASLATTGRSFRLGADSQTERTKRYLEKHFAPYNVVANAGHDPLPEAGATDEQTL